MPDPRFHKKIRTFTLKEIAEIGGASLDQSEKFYDFEIQDIASLDQAGPQELSFFDNIKYKDQFLHTKAGACFLHPKFMEMAPNGMKLLITPHPYRSYALAAQAFYPDALPASSIAETAKIHSEAIIGESCVIEDHVVIRKGARIGDYCIIEAGTVIGQNVVLGNHCRIGPNATITHSLIGNHVRIYPGVCIGQDGFGFAIDPKGHVKVPQLGRVIIEDSVEIGANTTIDRGAGPDTIIGQGSWIDNLVQIGHNVKIGRGCIIVAQTGVAGSTVLEDFVSLGGQVGIAGHLSIGKGARIAAQSGVMRNVPAATEYMGSPAVPIKSHMRQIAALNKLIKKKKDA